MRTYQAPYKAAERYRAGRARSGVVLSDYRSSLTLGVQRNDTGLPDDLKRGVETLSGYSLDDVRVHYNSSTPAALNADAFTQGSHIHIAPGQQKHLPHEAWHVVQQKQGRVQAMRFLKGNTKVNDSLLLENEANVMGNKAVISGEASGGATNLLTAILPLTSTVQLKTSITYDGLKKFDFNYVNDQDEVKHASGDVGTAMSATLDPDDPSQGSDTSASDAFKPLFQALQSHAPPVNGWVRGHLLNHDLGGIANYNNLFPITKAANSEHYYEVEKLVKHWVSEGCEVSYRVMAEKSNDDPGDASGVFHCYAQVVKSDDKKYTGKKIDKSIHSKSRREDFERLYKSGVKTARQKYGAVGYGDRNNVLRDEYKGSFRKDVRWEHQVGRSGQNIDVVGYEESFSDRASKHSGESSSGSMAGSSSKMSSSRLKRSKLQLSDSGDMDWLSSKSKTDSTHVIASSSKPGADYQDYSERDTEGIALAIASEDLDLVLEEVEELVEGELNVMCVTNTSQRAEVVSYIVQHFRELAEQSDDNSLFHLLEEFGNIPSFTYNAWKSFNDMD